jgi:hypothetical protein
MRVWTVIQSLGEPAKKPIVAAHTPHVAPEQAKSAHKGQPRQASP